MAYQNVGTPRFFIDNYQYLRALGLNPEEYINETSSINNQGNNQDSFFTPLSQPESFTLAPEIARRFRKDTGALRIFIPCGEEVRGMDFSGNMKWYGAVLNHNLGDCDSRIQNIMFMGAVNTLEHTYSVGDEEEIGILNAGVGINVDLMQNGSSIFYSDNVPIPEIDETTQEEFGERFTGFAVTTDALGGSLKDFQAGAISMGVMYTMPRSADLELTMKISYDGLDKITTLGGSTLSNIRHTGVPSWNFAEFSATGYVTKYLYSSPFSVGKSSEQSYLGGARRNGRREWELSFSYIGDSDLFSSNYSLGNHMETTSDYNDADKNTSGDSFEYNMFTDDSFIAQVWNKTLGGALPFIFQPDSNNDNPDQFCIAKFDMKSLEVAQVAYKVYSISLKIREIW